MCVIYHARVNPHPWFRLPSHAPQFGLRAREIVGAVNTLAEEGMLDW